MSVKLSIVYNYIGLKLSVKREITMEVYLQSYVKLNTKNDVHQRAPILGDAFMESVLNTFVQVDI